MPATNLIPEQIWSEAALHLVFHPARFYASSVFCSSMLSLNETERCLSYVFVHKFKACVVSPFGWW